MIKGNENAVAFNMSIGDKIRADKKNLDRVINKSGLQGKITKFTFDNTDIVQDKVVLELEAPYYEFKPKDSNKVYRLGIVRGDNYSLRAASENLRNQLFKDTAKSAYNTIVNEPTDFLFNTTPVNVRCDKFTLSEDKMTVTLEGNVQLTDGGTRSLLIWEMQEYEGNIFEECLKSICVPINIHTRIEYGDNVKLASNSASRNTSTQVSIYNVAMGSGIFDDIITYFGSYAMLLSKKGLPVTSKAYGTKYSAQAYIDDFIGLDPYTYHSALSPELLDYGVKSNMKSFCDKTISYARKGEIEKAKGYISYMKPLGEDSARLTEFLDFEFLPLVYKVCPQYFGSFVNDKANGDGSYKIRHSRIFSLNDPSKERLYVWNSSTRRMLIMCMRALIKETEHGLSFEVNPIDLLKNESFVEMLCSFIDCKLTLTKDAIGEGKMKKSAVDGRNKNDAEAIYKKISEYIDTYKKLMVKH